MPRYDGEQKETKMLDEYMILFTCLSYINILIDY